MPETYILAKTCVMCGNTHELEVLVSEYEAWGAGAYAQNAFPNVSDADRELFFISGICGTCFDKMFGE